MATLNYTKMLAPLLLVLTSIMLFACSEDLKVLVANRGEIACRVIETCTRLGVPTVAIYTKPDALSPHVKKATQAVYLGESPSLYSSKEDVLKAATSTGCSAIHPGYGFLSENPDFATMSEQAGLTWLGPKADVISRFALKHEAREIAEKAGVPVIPGTGGRGGG